MGTTYKTTHRVEYRTTALEAGKCNSDRTATGNSLYRVCVMGWKGRANPKALAAWMQAMDASFKPNGANAHLNDGRVTFAQLVNQNTGSVVCHQHGA